MLIYNICFPLSNLLICMTLSRSIYVSTNDPLLFLLWLGNIPLCAIVYKWHIFFIHPSVDGYLGCSHEKGNQKKAGVAILISDKINFKIKAIARDKDGHYLMIKGSIQEDYNNCRYPYTQHRSTYFLQC